MDTIVNLILDNSVLILSLVIVVLLAIVGYFADKTEFGQRKAKVIKVPKPKKVEPVAIDKSEKLELPIEASAVSVEIENEFPKEKEIITADNLTVENIDEGFDQLMPKKSMFDDSLLSSIDSLTFDEQKKASKRIPKMEDIELPKIESLSDDIDDLWRF